MEEYKKWWNSLIEESRPLSSMQLTAYIEFGVMIYLEDDSLYQPVLEKICQETEEYFL
jgi:hypothetical protein